MNYPNYVEMTFKTAFRRFPELFKELPPVMLYEFLNDDLYVVRIDKNSYQIEVGYPSDKWTIN